MSARSALPNFLVPARRKARPMSVHHHQQQQQLSPLESMLNRTVLSVQRATHLDILKLGDRFVSAKEPVSLTAQPAGVDADSLLLEAQARFDRELRLARESLRRDLTSEKEQALAEQKAEFEKHLDHVCSLRDKAEDMAKRDLRRSCELERQAALRQLRDSMEMQHRQEVDRARAEERQLARRSATAEQAEAVARALEQAELEFKRREQQAVEKSRQECRRQFNEELAGVRKRHREEVDSWMTKYKNLYKNFEQLLDSSRTVTGDFRGIQADYKRFLDYSDGQFHSDYMMKLRHLCGGPEPADTSATSPVPTISVDVDAAQLPMSSGTLAAGRPSPNRQKVSVSHQMLQQQTPRKHSPSPLSATPRSTRLPAAAASAASVHPRLSMKHAEVYMDEDVF